MNATDKDKAKFKNKERIVDMLKVLDEKVTRLIQRLKELKAENEKFSAKNTQLTAKLEAMESSMLLDIKHIEELDQEKALTRMVVDDLIKNIDLLVKGEEKREQYGKITSAQNI